MTEGIDTLKPSTQFHSLRGPAHYSGTSIGGLRRIAVVRSDVIALHLVAGEDQSNNEPIQTESLGEDKDKDNTDEQLWLASVRSDTSIADNANSNTSRETSHTTAKPSSKGGVSRVRGITVWGGALNG